MKKTKDFLYAHRQDPLLSMLIPQRCCRSLPVPNSIKGLALIGIMYYQIEGVAGKRKIIRPPLARVFFDKVSGKVVDLRMAPIFWKPDHNAKNVAGHFPGPGILGLTNSETAILLEEYCDSVDRLLGTVNEERVLGTDILKERWATNFQRLKEDGFDDYYRQLLKPSFDSIIAGPHTNTVRASCKKALPRQRSITHDIRGSKKANELMQRVHKLVKAANIEPESITSNRLGKLSQDAPFSIAVVGECGRGKSTIINRILEDHLLPVGPQPTSRLVTRILYEPNPRVIHMKNDLSHTQYNLAQLRKNDFWDEIQTSGRGGVLQVEISHPFLKENYIHLIDTPGAFEDLDQQRKTEAEIIARCDAIIIAVSATMPLSMLEMDFIEDHIQAVNRPKAAVFLTHLDLIAPKEITPMIANIRQRLSRRFPDIPLWADGKDLVPSVKDKMECATLETIREQIRKWANDPDLGKLRETYFYKQLMRQLQNARNVLEVRKNAIWASTKGTDMDRRSVRHQLENQRRNWEDVIIKLRERGMGAEKFLAEQLNQARQHLIEKMEFDLKITQDPKIWWETTLPYKLKIELRGMSGRIENAIRSSLLNDTRWLESEIQRQFGVKSVFENEDEMFRSRNELAMDNSDKPMDIKMLQLHSRIGLATLTIGGLLFPPMSAILIGSAIFGAAGSELFFKKQVAEQKEKLAKSLDSVLERLFDRYQEEYAVILRKAYSVLQEQVQLENVLWEKAQMAPVQKDLDYQKNPLEQIEELIRETDDTLTLLGKMV